jgi:hypothetical protein
MKLPFRAAAALALVLPILAAGRAHAQGEDALVLPRGVVQGSVQGTFSDFHQLFADGRTPLGSIFDTPFAAAAFVPTSTVRDSLQRIFDATRARTASGALTLTAADVALGTYTVNLAAEQRIAPLSLRAGVTNWLTVGVTLPIEYRSTEFDGAHMVDAAIGPNPDPTNNRTALQAIDSSFGAFGGGAYLPLRDSPAGIELMRRYELLRKVPTDSLILPTRGINETELTTLLRALPLQNYPFRNQTRRYAPGDLEVSARVKLLNTTGARWSPLRGGHGLRVAAEAAFRLPTGQGNDVDSLTEVPTTSGQGGASGAVFADLFSGRFWVSASGRLSHFFARDVVRHFYIPGAPFTLVADSAVLSRTPGERIEIGITPRYRLTNEISLAGRYALLRQGGVSYSGLALDGNAIAGIESAESQTAHLAGVGMSYSTLPAYAAGRANVPYDASILYESAVSGSGGAPALSQITLSARLYIRAWGVPRRPRAAADSTAPAAPAPRDSASVAAPARPTSPPQGTVTPAPRPSPANPATTPPSPAPAAVTPPPGPRVR